MNASIGPRRPPRSDLPIVRSWTEILELLPDAVFIGAGAASRDEALEHIKSQGFRPDLILSDYQLPMGYTGAEIVAEIAALLGFKPPTIMLTGDIADRHIGNAKMIADRILSKPVDVNRLLREMETLLGKPD
jgi:two-component system, chemotaxis family, CheB/CheR fusion protein